MKGSLQAAATAFVCRKCTKGLPNQWDAAVQINGLDIGHGDILESVGKFFYLGDMLNANGGAEFGGG